MKPVPAHPVTAAEAETLEGTWKPILGYAGYEASHRAVNLDGIRSVDRTVKSRRYRGQPIAARLSTRGYPQVNVRADDGRMVTIEVHALVMLAHEGPCPPGLQVRHWNDDPLDNRWAPGGEAGCRAGAGNLVYGTPKENAADKRRNRPSPPLRSRGVMARVRHAVSRLRRRRL